MITKEGKVIIDKEFVTTTEFVFDKPFDVAPQREALHWAMGRLLEAMGEKDPTRGVVDISEDE